MKEYYGNISSPIWLIGDSPPKYGADFLDHPLDPKHPTVHNIWTPILYKIQKRYDMEKKDKFIDFDKKLYIRNAITEYSLKPEDKKWENDELNSQLEKMKILLKDKGHQMIITFGQFSYEFIRRCLYDCDTKFKKYNHTYWGVERLGNCFRDAIKKEESIIPLLHIIISKKWKETHQKFTKKDDENYFDYVAGEMYPRFIKICSQ